MPKSPSEVGEDMGSSLVFRPHAIIATDRSVPSPIFVAALIGVEKILRIDFDTSPAQPLSVLIYVTVS